MPRRLVVVVFAFLLLAGCTNGGNSATDDPDGDLLGNANETAPRIIEVHHLDRVERREVTSDPDKADTDGDGLSDLDEVQRGTDPRDPDTDDDGLLDGDDAHPDDQETIDAWRRQGIVEVNGTFLGELDACPPDGPQLKPYVASSDLPVPDQLLDGEELRGWDVTVRGNTYRVTSNPCVPDTDGDGMRDDAEKAAGSDPRHVDTDRDGVNDWGDVDPTADVYLEFHDLAVDGPNGTVRVTFLTALTQATLVAPGDGSALLNVHDGRGSEGNSTEIGLTMAVTDSNGAPVNLTGDPGGAILFFDVVQGTVKGARVEGDRLSFTGGDGSMSFRWSVERR